MSTLNSNTTLQHPETGHSVKLLAGDEVPSWAEDLVGAHLLGDGRKSRRAVRKPEASDGSSPVAATFDQVDALYALVDSLKDVVVAQGEQISALSLAVGTVLDELVDGDEAPAGGADPLPPTSGKGSGTEAWQKYADDHGIQYPQGAGRDEILAAVQAHQAQ